MYKKKHFVRLTKVAYVEIEEGESVANAVERADILDSDASLLFKLFTDIVDADDNILEEI